MIKEMAVERIAALHLPPILIDTWTSTPAPDKRVNRWELYRETEVNRLITSVKAGKNIVICGREQAGKSTMMVESYFALLAQSVPTFGFSTRQLLPELPFTNDTNQSKIMASLGRIPEGQAVLLDNIDYLFRTYESMSLHPHDGHNYTDSANKVTFEANCAEIFSHLNAGNFRLVFSLHNDWQHDWIDHNRHQLWLNGLGDNFDLIELNPCLEPAKAEAYLRFERGITLPEIDPVHLGSVLSSIPFNSLKKKSAEQIFALF